MRYLALIAALLFASAQAPFQTNDLVINGNGTISKLPLANQTETRHSVDDYKCTANGQVLVNGSGITCSSVDPDDTLALNRALTANVPLFVGRSLSLTGAISTTTCPDIVGVNYTKSVFNWAGAGGLTVTCTVGTTISSGARIMDIGFIAGAVNSGTALTINITDITGQAPYTRTAEVRRNYFGQTAANVSVNGWATAILINNARNVIVSENHINGNFNAPGTGACMEFTASTTFNHQTFHVENNYCTYMRYGEYVHLTGTNTDFEDFHSSDNALTGVSYPIYWDGTNGLNNYSSAFYSARDVLQPVNYTGPGPTTPGVYLKNLTMVDFDGVQINSGNTGDMITVTSSSRVTVHDCGWLFQYAGTVTGAVVHFAGGSNSNIQVHSCMYDNINATPTPSGILLDSGTTYATIMPSQMFGVTALITDNSGRTNNTFFQPSPAAVGALTLPGTITGGALFAVSANPFLMFGYTSGGTDAKYWQCAPGPNTFSCVTFSDSLGTSNAWMQVTRSGAAITSVAFPAPVLLSGGMRTTLVGLGSTSYSVAAADTSLVLAPSGTFTLTLPAAASNNGRILYIKLAAAFAVTSASSNVVPLAGGAAGSAIMPATAGKFVMLQSDSVNWHVIMGN